MDYFYEKERKLTLAFGPEVVSACDHRLLINMVTIGLQREIQNQICIADPQSKADLVQCLQRMTVNPRQVRSNTSSFNANRNASKSDASTSNSNQTPSNNEKRNASVTDKKTGPASRPGQSKAWGRFTNRITSGHSNAVKGGIAAADGSSAASAASGQQEGNDDMHVSHVSVDAINQLPVYLLSVNDRKVKLRTLLDTGSDVDLISADAVNKNQIPAHNETRTFIASTGSHLPLHRT